MTETVSRVASIGPELESPTGEIELVDLIATPTAIVRFAGPASDFPRLLADAFERTSAAITACAATISGPPFGRYYSFGQAAIEAEAGFPYLGELCDEELVSRGVVRSELPGGRAATLVHVGPYQTVVDAWTRAQAWIAEHELTVTAAPWECYLSEPQVPPLEIRTGIFFPLG